MLLWLEGIFFKANGEYTKIIKKAVLAGPTVHYGVFLHLLYFRPDKPFKGLCTERGFSKNVFVLSEHAAVQAEGRFIHN